MTRHRKLGAAALVVALLPGTALAQAPATADTQLPSGSVYAQAPAGSAASRPTPLSLDDALERALSESEEVRAAEARVDGARAQVRAARSALLPQVSTQLAYSRTLRSIFQGGFEMDDSMLFNPDPNAPIEDRLQYLEQNAPLAGLGGLGALFSNLPFGQEHTWIGGLNISQTLFAGGRVRASLNAASAAEDAARAALEETRTDIGLQVKEAYYNAALAARAAEIVDASVELAREHLDEVRLRHDAGRASELEVMRAEVELSNLEPQLIQARNGRDLALLNLKRLINLPIDAEVELTTVLEPSGAAAERLTALELPRLEEASDRLDRRAAVRAAEDHVEIMRQQVSAARGAYLPAVALTGNLSRQAFPSVGAFPGSADWRDDWSVGIALQWTPFDGFRREAEVQAARSQVRQAELQLDQLLEGVRLEYEQAYGEFRRAQRQLEAAASTVAAAERVYDLTELRYAEGMATQLDVSNARLALQQARLNQVQAFHDAYLAVARAERALGIPVEQTLRPAR